jgi:hypothetical protein
MAGEQKGDSHLISVDKLDALTLKVSHVMESAKRLDLDFYFFFPSEIGINSQVLSENELYYSAMTEKRAYFSGKTHLPLVHSRLAKRGKLSDNQYRVSLSLYAYQYVIALDSAVNGLRASIKASDTVTEDEVDEVIHLSLGILKKLRRSVPYEEAQVRYYVNIDNYLSWYTEQKFLALVAHLPRGKEYTLLRDRLITICEREQAHRVLKKYNSKKVNEDVTRLSNKMRLLRRLIEHPIVLKSKTSTVGKNQSRAIKGIATGLVMVFVSLSLIAARDYLGEITASFVFAMSVIYALREIFKDDLRDVMWRWIRKGKPKWRKDYIDPSTKKRVGGKLEWLDYTRFESLPDRIKTIRKTRVSQREEQVLHYHSKAALSTTLFLSGYEQTRESMMFNLRPITRFMDRNSNRIYSLNDGQVSRENVEKRHLINLIVKEDRHDGAPTYSRFKLIVSRSKIVDIEKIELDKKKS